METNAKIGSTRPPHFDGLDVLRGLAIVMVLAFHAWVIRPQWQWAWVHTVGHGAHGVGLFFVVSALTLASSWQYRRGRDRRPALAFWARRWWRIAPLFYLVLMLTWVAHSGNPQTAPPSMQANVFTWSNLLAHLTFIFGWIPADQNSWIGVEWSIGAEMTFYLLFPWIVSKLIPRYGYAPLLAMGLAASILWAWGIPRIGSTWPGWAQGFPFWCFVTQAPAFLAGLWIWSSRRPVRRKWGAWCVGGAGIVAAIAIHRWPLDESAVAWVLPCGVLTFLVWHDFPVVRWLSHNGVLRYIGTRSYSWYLLHWMLLNQVVMKFGPAAAVGFLPYLVRLGCLIGLTVVAGELGYRLVEQPGIRLGKRWLAHMRWGPESSSNGPTRTLLGPAPAMTSKRGISR